MTSSKFTFNGMGPRDRVLVLRKECELMELERMGHRQVISRLLMVISWASLTNRQARAVTKELSERRRIVRAIRQRLDKHQQSIKRWSDRAVYTQQRTQRAQDFNEGAPA